MTQHLERDVDSGATGFPARSPLDPTTTHRVSVGTVRRRRLVGVLLVVLPLVWAGHRAVTGGTGLVNWNGLRLLDDLLATALSPALDPTFLRIVLDGAVVTIAFAALGTLGALLIGAVGGLVLSDVAWARHPPALLRMTRLGLRGVLVAARSIHELVWALLLVSVLGLDPLVGVLAIAIPFGAQTAKVFGETLDNVPAEPLWALRHSGARSLPAMAYALLPGASPLLLSYSFYRFECAIRSAVLLGVVGLGGLGQELVVSLQSRNWDEVWTLIFAVLLLSAVVDLWSTRLRSDMAVVNCTEISPGLEGLPQARTGRRSRWARWSAVVGALGMALAWWVSDVSLAGLTSERTRTLATTLLGDLFPPALPLGGWVQLIASVADTVAMAVLAMAVAVALTLVLGPWATQSRPAPGHSVTRLRRAAGLAGWLLARFVLLFLRSVPPTVWAIVALLALFPGILPGALALGLYTGGILGRLVAEAWESIDTQARDALRRSGVRPSVAAIAAIAPPSGHHLLTYTLYRFEICVRDTAVVGVVGAAGLGRLLAENLAVFRFPVVTTVLLASFAVSVGAELLGRWLRRATRV
ncbi:MAG: PhnE/PtxC family ABC transporter permease [Ornithinimicrobium sp.]|uniref:PhnE/PtxC family ABC transporter permease n=1 Tax=Ornithinimicrobium sp. TaxID=1977084 RepID=UPI003D9ABA2E